MPRYTAESKQALLDQLIAKVHEHHSAREAELIAKFIPQYYANISLEDLEERSLEDLYGSLLSHWRLINTAKAGEVHVRVYNPSLETEGWHTPHTVIEIVQDDMPFLVDSIRLEIQRRGWAVHQVVHLGGLRVRRGPAGIEEIYSREATEPKTEVCAPIYLEIDKQTEPQVLAELETALRAVLRDVALMVRDRDKMFHALDEAIQQLTQSPSPEGKALTQEAIAFLQWMKKYFIVFGCRDYRLRQEQGEYLLEVVPNSGLGLLADPPKHQVRRFKDLPPEAQQMGLSIQELIISKTNTKSTIRRAGYTDYVGIKYFDEKGNILGERRFLGLYISGVALAHPSEIPVIRMKVEEVLKRSKLTPGTHAYKKLRDIVDNFPKDDLFQATTEELLALCMGIFYLQEREKVRLFIRRDSYGRYFSCFVYVPQERYNTDLAQRMQAILAKAFQAKEISSDTFISTSTLARVHFEVRVDPTHFVMPDVAHVEALLQEVGRSWRDDLREALIEQCGEAQGVAYYNRYRYVFPVSYRESVSVRFAVIDIEHLETLVGDKVLALCLYRSVDAVEQNIIHLKVYQKNQEIALSDVLPILENLGFRVLNENGYELDFGDTGIVYINDFEIMAKSSGEVALEEIREDFQEAFTAVWQNQAENDAFNQLVLAQLSWREVVILRAYAAYFQQLGFTFSQAYVAQTLIEYSRIAKALIALFEQKFNPDGERSTEKFEAAVTAIEALLNGVSNLDQDRILRQYLMVIRATVRTNLYQSEPGTEPASYVAFKLAPREITNAPLPKPLFEIFVYSLRVEGVHLRFAEVSRGGIRWSDRREDYRTEVLGLMKAQQVKNAVIIPQGAKGGFYPKHLPVQAGRDAIQEEAIACYKIFIEALLSLTDNLVNQQIVPPVRVVRYDKDDPYLVVAADKGTATFSDIANSISLAHEFWLGDAFASGGSAGYDHKKMGITAKGAWESVQRHFRELNLDTQTEPFTVVGIGDMSGDVFGNGMLLSHCIKLVAAFNHAHIFFDPTPDPEKSFAERERLFKLPRSSWEDYNSTLISAGGGIFKRSAKSISLTPEMKQCLQVTVDTLTPTDLIQAILKMPVDLLWNGGIGTYVKSASETHADVRDRANDALRVNGEELRCRVVGEGGNMGCTQLGRIEYELNGGRIYTDFIDNSAGVDCSDHEVNIKILLNQVVADGKMTMEERNALLVEMTTEISELVLIDNYRQTQAISLAAERAAANLGLYARFLAELERKNYINRTLEFLPSEKALVDRKAKGFGLTRPELAVLFAYTKNILKAKLLESDLPDDPAVFHFALIEFPQVMHERFHAYIETHPLKREMIATHLANRVINEMGVTFIARLRQETGATIVEVVRAFIIADAIFEKEALWRAVEKLDRQISAQLQFALLRRMNRMIRKATRWLIRHQRPDLTTLERIQACKEPVQKLREELPRLLSKTDRAQYDADCEEYLKGGVPEALARLAALNVHFFAVLDIIEVAREAKLDLFEIAEAYFQLGELFELGWLRTQITELASKTHWDALARSNYRDDLDLLQRYLAMSVLAYPTQERSITQKVQEWVVHHETLFNRWQQRLAEMKAQPVLEPVMFSVILRELMDWAQSEREQMYQRHKK